MKFGFILGITLAVGLHAFAASETIRITNVQYELVSDCEWKHRITGGSWTYHPMQLDKGGIPGWLGALESFELSESSDGSLVFNNAKSFEKVYFNNKFLSLGEKPLSRSLILKFTTEEKRQDGRSEERSCCRRPSM